MRTLFTLLALLASTAVFAVSDYPREKKWADEITPGIVVGDPVYIEQANKHKFLGIYTEASNAKAGVVVAHGMGIHPDWGMIGILRSQLADMGYTTLSIQMPILAVDAKPEDYPPTFPEAVERLKLAVDYLKNKGHKKIAIVSHSLGSRMTRDFMAANPPEVAGWASLGIGGGVDYAGIKAPVLDLYGAKDLPPVLANAGKRAASLKDNPVSKQVVVPGADHFFAGHEGEMVAATKAFLDGLK